MQRRQFLGALTATCLTAGPLANRSFANEPIRDDLNWRCETIQTIAQNRARRAPVVTGVSLQPKGSNLAIVGDDHHIGIYDIERQSYVDHLSAHTDWVRAARFTPNGKTLVTAGNDRTVRIWSTGDWGSPVMTRNHDSAIIEVALSPNSPWLAAVGFEKSLRVYDIQTGREALQFECACADNHAVAFSPDNQLVAAGGRSGAIRVWNLKTGKLVHESKPHRQRIRSIEFTPQNEIVSAGDDQRIYLINPLQRPDQPRAFPRNASKLYATALLNDGLLATGGSDNQITVWQLANLRQAGTLKGHTGTVSCLDFADNKLVSGSYDTQVRLWHTETYTSSPNPRHTQLKNGWNGRLN